MEKDYLFKLNVQPHVLEKYSGSRIETLKNELDSNDQNQQKIIDHINSILSSSKIDPNERQLA